jgi:uncharacterized protein YjiS (DUF1127 family)
MSTLHRDTSLSGLFWSLSSVISPTSQPAAVPPARWDAGAVDWLRRAAATVRLWQERSRARQELLTLDDHILRDVGLTPYEVRMEAYKPFWRA